VGNSSNGTPDTGVAGAVTVLGNFSSYIGNRAGSSGRVTVSGSGAEWHSGYRVEIGSAGSGRLDISNGGVVTTSAPGIGGVGVIGLDNTGLVTVSGTGSLWYLGDVGRGYSGGLYVGSGGTLEISGGGWVEGSGESCVGGPDSLSGTAVVRVSGQGSQWITGGGAVCR